MMNGQEYSPKYNMDNFAWELGIAKQTSRLL